MKLLSLKRLAVYVSAYILILGVLFVVTDIWKVLDYKLVKSFYFSKTERNALRSDILIFNYERPEDINDAQDIVTFYRNGIVNFLNTVLKRYPDEKPKAVILDFSYSNNRVLINELKEVLDSLKPKIKVYAVYDTRDAEKTSFEEHDKAQASELYDSYFQGNRLDAAYNYVYGLLTYQPDSRLKTKNGDLRIIKSLVREVDSDANPDPNEVDRSSEGYLLALGDSTFINKQKHMFVLGKSLKEAGDFEPEVNIDDKFLVIGDLKNDFSQEVNIPGTYIMAWALNDQLNGNTIAKQPFNEPVVIIGQLLFFSFFVIVNFALLFKYVKRLQTKPILLAIIAYIVGSGFLFLYGILILSINKVPLIGLTLIGMLVAAFLSWRFAYKFLVTGIAEGSQKYDVFISYSHGDSDWVKENVFQPLDAFRKPNGDKLNIFFDTKSIGIGEPFTSKYMWGIVDSKVFIPVISEEYYGKNHCKNEMDLAYKRSVEKLLDILPIVFSYEVVPQIYTHINFLDITVNQNFMDAIQKTIIELDQKGVGSRAAYH